MHEPGLHALLCRYTACVLLPGNLQCVSNLFGWLAFHMQPCFRSLVFSFRVSNQHTVPQTEICSFAASAFCLICCCGCHFETQLLPRVKLTLLIVLSILKPSSEIKHELSDNELCSSRFCCRPLAAKFGMVNTMVLTHLPSNVLTIMVPLMPTLNTTLLALFLRQAIAFRCCVVRHPLQSASHEVVMKCQLEACY